ncbi:hypothetical protein BU23DRAFT_595453 [Bimuria novae-zelandiae CBS 107.79]|uniref:Uncharacterized protein n=1 Tax=Bimuria novae-zelandiae CBS 107.79 TaxID=1447943 RepID=A0A6A5VQ95_9PLEO|nr:hypothetical protein BU23DRAFT_595453 [Bimuria novae-zelandiae CBS 107.79]
MHHVSGNPPLAWHRSWQSSCGEGPPSPTPAVSVGWLAGGAFATPNVVVIAAALASKLPRAGRKRTSSGVVRYAEGDVLVVVEVGGVEERGCSSSSSLPSSLFSGDDGLSGVPGGVIAAGRAPPRGMNGTGVCVSAINLGVIEVVVLWEGMGHEDMQRGEGDVLQAAPPAPMIKGTTTPPMVVLEVVASAPWTVVVSLSTMVIMVVAPAGVAVVFSTPTASSDGIATPVVSAADALRYDVVESREAVLQRPRGVVAGDDVDYAARVPGADGVAKRRKAFGADCV